MNQDYNDYALQKEKRRKKKHYYPALHPREKQQTEETEQNDSQTIKITQQQ